MSTVRDIAQQFVVTATAEEGGKPKYWTGEMLGRWPVIVGNQERAARMELTVARRAVVEFGTRLGKFAWLTAPAP